MMPCWSRILAAALITQLSLMAPAMGGTAQGHSIEPAALICSGRADSAEARAALAELSEIVSHGSAHGSQGPTPHDHDEHCPACALAKAITLPEAAALPASVALSFTTAALQPGRVLPRQTAGPPVGLRAPPLTI